MAESREPEGLTWQSITAVGEAAAVPRVDGSLTVLQPIEVQFAAVEGGGMEEAPGLHTIRAAVAMFHVVEGDWIVGRCLFNVELADVTGKLRSDDAAAD